MNNSSNNNDNNKVRNIVLLCALWILYFVCINKELLTGIYTFLALILCIIASIIVVGVEYVNRKIEEFFSAVKTALYVLMSALIKLLAAIQIFERISSLIDIYNGKTWIILIIFFALVIIGALLFNEWLSYELMISSIALPQVRSCILDMGYSQTNSGDPIYLAIFVLVFINLFLNEGERKIKKWPVVVFAFNSIAITRCYGYFESVVNYKTINYILVFIIFLLLQCMAFFVFQAFMSEE